MQFHFRVFHSAQQWEQLCEISDHKTGSLIYLQTATPEFPGGVKKLVGSSSKEHKANLPSRTVPILNQSFSRA